MDADVSTKSTAHRGFHIIIYGNTSLGAVNDASDAPASASAREHRYCHLLSPYHQSSKIDYAVYNQFCKSEITIYFYGLNK